MKIPSPFLANKVATPLFALHLACPLNSFSDTGTDYFIQSETNPDPAGDGI
jgi:hypothetical protein